MFQIFVVELLFFLSTGRGPETFCSSDGRRLPVCGWSRNYSSLKKRSVIALCRKSVFILIFDDNGRGILHCTAQAVAMPVGAVCLSSGVLVGRDIGNLGVFGVIVRIDCCY